MEEVVLVSGCRTAIGRMGGGFKDIPASDLVGPVVREAMDRADLTPEQIEEAISVGAGGAVNAATVDRYRTARRHVPGESPTLPRKDLEEAGVHSAD